MQSLLHRLSNRELHFAELLSRSERITLRAQQLVLVHQHLRVVTNHLELGNFRMRLQRLNGTQQRVRDLIRLELKRQVFKSDTLQNDLDLVVREAKHGCNALSRLFHTLQSTTRKATQAAE